jgi:hypothetical protein
MFKHLDHHSLAVPFILAMVAAHISILEEKKNHRCTLSTKERARRTSRSQLQRASRRRNRR